ncbi:MAG: hypothetical protein IJQ16_09400 [Selenomonadaceae bacterium]|nr:hypothetical protein [Selenomonadaceae bacterium]
MTKFEKIIKKLMLIFLVLTVTAAGFNGFFLKWTLRDGDPNFGLVAYMEGTAKRPFAHRVLIPNLAKTVASAIPDEQREKLAKRLIERREIEKKYAQAEVPPKYVIEYYLTVIFAFLSLFAAVWVLRSIVSEVTGDKVVGTLTACLYALIIPYIEVLGGYFYDFPEFLAFFLAVRFALSGNLIGILILTPIAELNKETFFFFIPALLPFVMKKLDFKKSVAYVLGAMFVAGVTYLLVLSRFAGNPGDMADWRIIDHAQDIFRLNSYFITDSIYGIALPSRMFITHIIYVVWIAKTSWKYLTDDWKLHIKIATVINGILYFMFVLPGELRDLSLLQMSLMILTAYFIKELIHKNYNLEIEK